MGAPGRQLNVSPEEVETVLLSREGENDPWLDRRAAAAARAPFLLSAEQARELCDLPLVFGAEIMLRHGRSADDREREHESEDHSWSVRHTAKSLGALGYRIYPGSVGVEGVMALADLLAFDEKNQPLFVEILTNASVKFGQHKKKLPLIAAVPEFCFVVARLPKRFLASLPSHCYAVRGPWSPRTLGGAWIPPWLRAGGAAMAPLFSIEVTRKRSVAYLRVSAWGLRATDESSHARLVHYALHDVADRARLMAFGFEARWLYGHGPLRRLVHPDSNLRLDCYPWELRGSRPVPRHRNGDAAHVGLSSSRSVNGRALFQRGPTETRIQVVTVYKTH